MRQQDQQELVTRLAAEFTLFAPATIARWVAHEAARSEATAVADHVRATLQELSRDGVTTAEELPLARASIDLDVVAPTTQHR